MLLVNNVVAMPARSGIKSWKYSMPTVARMPINIALNSCQTSNPAAEVNHSIPA
ncbi:hypothetical protein D3C86_2114400 [compost metagenome]